MQGIFFIIDYGKFNERHLIENIFMATIENADSNKNHPKQKLIKKSVRVDLTPMVDLGFLLITFFIFTTTMSKASAMNMNLPDDRDSSVTDAICKSCVLTVIAGENNQLFYYEGDDYNAVYKTTDYTASGIRQLIQNKKIKVFNARGVDEMKLIIKLSQNSSFKNMVDLIDESNITCVKRYYLANLNNADLKIVSIK